MDLNLYFSSLPKRGHGCSLRRSQLEFHRCSSGHLVGRRSISSEITLYFYHSFG